MKPSRFRPPGVETVTETTGVGPKRVYLDIQSHPQNVAYPPRPVPGSVADLDHIMSHCDFGQGKVSFSFPGKHLLFACLIFCRCYYTVCS